MVFAVSLNSFHSSFIFPSHSAHHTVIICVFVHSIVFCIFLLLSSLKVRTMFYSSLQKSSKNSCGIMAQIKNELMCELLRKKALPWFQLLELEVQAKVYLTHLLFVLPCWGHESKCVVGLQHIFHSRTPILAPLPCLIFHIHNNK